MNKKLLVIGGTGYIGSNLLKSLDSGADAVFTSRKVCDEFAFKNVVCDLLQEGWTNALPKDREVVIWCAQSLRYREFPEGIEDMFRVNVMAFHKMLEWARKSGIKKVIYLSTGSVYKPSDEVITEESVCDPADYYGRTKYISEQLVRMYNQFFGVEILRLFNVYGPNQQDKLIPNLIKSVKEGRAVKCNPNAPVYVYPYYIDDCVEYLKESIEASGKGVRVKNLFGPKRWSVEQIARHIGGLLGKEAIVESSEAVPSNYLLNCGGQAGLVEFEEGIKNLEL